MALTARRVETAAAGKYADGGRSGLWLQVSPTGARRWFVRVVAIRSSTGTSKRQRGTFARTGAGGETRNNARQWVDLAQARQHVVPSFG